MTRSQGQSAKRDQPLTNAGRLGRHAYPAAGPIDAWFAGLLPLASRAQPSVQRCSASIGFSYRSWGGDRPHGSDGMPMILLTSTGARTGRQSILPVLAIHEGDDLAVIRSNYGRPRHPAWYPNLIKQFEAEVTVGGRATAE